MTETLFLDLNCNENLSNTEQSLVKEINGNVPTQVDKNPLNSFINKQGTMHIILSILVTFILYIFYNYNLYNFGLIFFNIKIILK